MKSITQDALKKLGFRVDCTHLRDWHWLCRPGKPDVKVMSPGGRTFVKLTLGRMEFEGVSVCGPTDNFCRRTGFTKAAGRAFAQAKRKGVV
jgi:hypothetical protein